MSALIIIKVNKTKRSLITIKTNMKILKLHQQMFHRRKRMLIYQTMRSAYLHFIELNKDLKLILESHGMFMQGVYDVIRTRKFVISIMKCLNVPLNAFCLLLITRVKLLQEFASKTVNWVFFRNFKNYFFHLLFTQGALVCCFMHKH